MNYHGFFVILHSSRMVMYMKSKVIIFLLLFIGSISFIAGSYSLYRLYDKSNRMEHTVGVVTDLKTLQQSCKDAIVQSFYIPGK